MSEKVNYFYIDESGGILNNSSLFMQGCIKIDSPESIRNSIEKLGEQILEDLYFKDFWDRFKNEGFHATENNFDIRAEFYKVLPFLDFRAYFVILDKKTGYFEDLLSRAKEHEIFKWSLEKLLYDRINKNKGDRNIFTFENIELSNKKLNNILEEIFGTLGPEHKCEYQIAGKDEYILGAVDYLNYIFYNILSQEKTLPRMKQNFEIMAPKIAVVKFLHNGVHLSRKGRPERRLTLENVIREFGGQSR